jgi:anti-anti-sigma factor
MDRTNAMEIFRKIVGGSVVLSPVGRIELATADAFQDELLAALSLAGERSESGAVVVDCSHLDYVSSAGLRALVIAARKANGHGLGVAAMQPVVREIYAISRFDALVAAFETVRDALAKLDPAALDHLATGP